MDCGVNPSAVRAVDTDSHYGYKPHARQSFFEWYGVGNGANFAKMLCLVVKLFVGHQHGLNFESSMGISRSP